MRVDCWDVLLALVEAQQHCLVLHSCVALFPSIGMADARAVQVETFNWTQQWCATPLRLQWSLCLLSFVCKKHFHLLEVSFSGCIFVYKKKTNFPPGSRYPLFFVEDLDSKRPNKVQLLGRNIVVWQAPDGAWSALEDLCAHRLAPLSGAAHFIVRSRYFAEAAARLCLWAGVPRLANLSAAASAVLQASC